MMRGEPPLHVRPTKPDATILKDALEKADAPADARWSVGARMERPQSTLFPLKLLATDGTLILRAFYKVYRISADASPAEVQSKLSTFRRVVQRGGRLAEQFTQLAGDTAVHIPSVLASDIAHLTEVQVALPGRPLKRLALRALPGRRRVTRRAYRMLGTAMALFEQCRDADLAMADAPTFDTAAATRGLEGDLGDRDARRVRQLIEELIGTLHARPLRYVHGDVSADNILVTRTGLGLIDPLWSIRWQGADPALHAARLQTEALQYRAWTGDLVGEMLEGYGNASLFSEPVWQLMMMLHQARLARSRPMSPAGRLRRRRAVRALSEVLEPPIW